MIETAGDRAPASAGGARGEVPPEPGRLRLMSGPDLAGLLSAVDAQDLFLFRRLGVGEWLHVAGVGRGAGWSGIVRVDPTEGDRIAAAVPVGVVRRWSSAAPALILGPYYACGAAMVRVTTDVLVVVGRPDAPLDPVRASTAVLWDLAGAAVAQLGREVPVSKRLADELEVLQALQALNGAQVADVPAGVAHVAATVARALSCDLVVVVTAAGVRAVHSARPDSVPRVEAQERELDAMLEAAVRAAGAGPTWRQDSSLDPLPSPLAPQDGVVAHFVLPMGAPVGGAIVCVHSVDGPRGFTDLCRRMGLRLAEAATVLLATTALRDDLSARVRLDGLTGLASRAAWDELLEARQRDVDAGGSCGVVTLDVDNLKCVNDREGHAAGDELLRAVARRLVRALVPGEVAARLGGDEFAVLLPGADEEQVRRRRTSLHSAVERPDTDGIEVLVSAGGAASGPYGSLRAAGRAADDAMYATKRRRRGDAVSR